MPMQTLKNLATFAIITLLYYIAVIALTSAIDQVNHFQTGLQGFSAIGQMAYIIGWYTVVKWYFKRYGGARRRAVVVDDEPFMGEI